MTALAPLAAAGGGASPALSLPLLVELEHASTSYLEPAAFFVSWQGVLTLAYSGFTQALVTLKERITAAHPSLPPENPGSKWPKTSLGCLRDGKRLTPEQLATLSQICREDSSAFSQRPSRQGGQDGSSLGHYIRLAVDAACVALYECRSLERMLSSQRICFRGGVDAAGPPVNELQRVAAILAEPEADDYWVAVSRDGNRETHYRGTHFGATLVHFISAGSCGSGGAADREALLMAMDRFRRRVDAALPGVYAWFGDDSLHITLRALIN